MNKVEDGSGWGAWKAGNNRTVANTILHNDRHCVLVSLLLSRSSRHLHRLSTRLIHHHHHHHPHPHPHHHLFKAHEMSKSTQITAGTTRHETALTSTVALRIHINMSIKHHSKQSKAYNIRKTQTAKIRYLWRNLWMTEGRCMSLIERLNLSTLPN